MCLWLVVKERRKRRAERWNGGKSNLQSNSKKRSPTVLQQHSRLKTLQSVLSFGGELSSGSSHNPVKVSHSKSGFG